MLVIAFLTLLLTAIIPFLIWRLGSKQSKRDAELRKRQAESLRRQERTLQRQRRDMLISTLVNISSESHIKLLWAEIKEFHAEDRVLLESAIRSNPAIALPGSFGGVKLVDNLDQRALIDYTESLARRYGVVREYPAYSGLLEFLELALLLDLDVDSESIVSLVTGNTSTVQKPGHSFYRELVAIFPASAAGILRRVESIDSRVAGGLRFNVLTGVLLGLKDAELGREVGGVAPGATSVAELRSSVPTSLAELLHRDNLRSFDRWSKEGATEPVSAAVAWLVRAVGWLADTEDHAVMRMVQNLEPAILSVPSGDRSWGIDDKDVRQGVRWIQEKQPGLWAVYGPRIVAALDSVGKWR